MKKAQPDEKPSLVAVDAAHAPLALQKAEKGSHRSMWELLLELRVLIPYLSHLVPLLERSPIKASPEVNELSKGIAGIQINSRELETLSRNQAIQLERMEEQMARLRIAIETSFEENHKFFEEMRGFRRLMTGLVIVIFVLIGSTTGMVTYLLFRP